MESARGGRAEDEIGMFWESLDLEWKIQVMLYLVTVHISCK